MQELQLHRGCSRLARRILTGLAFTLFAFQASAQNTVSVPDAELRAILNDLSPAPAVHEAAGDVTVIEYFDYQCPVCRHLEPELHNLVAHDSKVRVVRKDWPVFGDVSAYAAYCTYAAAREGRYQIAHDALMSSRIDLDSKETVQAVLRAAGFDVRKLDADVHAHAEAYARILQRNAQETQALGLSGTPGLVVGSRLVAGSIDLAGLQKLVAQARANHS